MLAGSWVKLKPTPEPPAFAQFPKASLMAAVSAASKSGLILTFTL
jgi:hypothetical protein